MFRAPFLAPCSCYGGEQTHPEEGCSATQVASTTNRDLWPDPIAQTIRFSQSNLSDLTGSPSIADFRRICACSENRVTILGSDQKERRPWE